MPQDYRVPDTSFTLEPERGTYQDVAQGSADRKRSLY
jgi:hypothetical protein